MSLGEGLTFSPTFFSGIPVPCLPAYQEICIDLVCVGSLSWCTQFAKSCQASEIGFGPQNLSSGGTTSGHSFVLHLPRAKEGYVIVAGSQPGFIR